MEDSKKNKERKVLTDEELEQVSGGRVVFDIDYGSCYKQTGMNSCVYFGCHWSEKLKRCFWSKKDRDAEEAKLGASGAS